MRFKCPLCGQPVSASLYEKITGIWQERNKVLSKIRQQRAELIQKIKKQKESLREQKKQFRDKKAQLINVAVKRQTRRINRSLERLGRKQQVVEERANKRIQRAMENSHRRAEKLAGKLANQRLARMKKELRSSLKAQIKNERRSATEKVTKRYEHLQNTFRTTLIQMKSQAKENKQSKQRIEELERQLRRQTTPQIEGLLYEGSLLAELKKIFEDDIFDHTGKGGDIIQHVYANKTEAGIIVYECKRVKNFQSKFVTQALIAKEKRKGDFAILVTNAMKRGTQGFFTQRGVIVIHATGVLSLATILRTQIIQLSEMKLSRLERESAIKLTLEYLQGPEFSNSMDSIIGETISLYKELKDEMKKHFAAWKKRYESYAKIHSEALAVTHTTKAVIRGEEDYKKILLKNDYPVLVELPLTES